MRMEVEVEVSVETRALVCLVGIQPSMRIFNNEKPGFLLLFTASLGMGACGSNEAHAEKIATASALTTESSSGSGSKSRSTSDGDIKPGSPTDTSAATGSTSSDSGKPDGDQPSHDKPNGETPQTETPVDVEVEVEVDTLPILSIDGKARVCGTRGYRLSIRCDPYAESRSGKQSQSRDQSLRDF